MHRPRLPQLTYSNVVSTICLFLLLGGGAYAASQLPKNSVGTKQLKNEAVTDRKIAKKTLRKFIRPGPAGATGAVGPTGSPGRNAQFGETLAAGATAYGSWNIQDAFEPAVAREFAFALPAPAPVVLTDATVNFGAAAASLATDEDASCGGTATAPTAPPGKVCIYTDYGGFSSNGLTGEALRLNPEAPASSIGFTISTGTAGNNGSTGGTWAYTAP